MVNKQRFEAKLEKVLQRAVSSRVRRKTLRDNIMRLLEQELEKK
jgi:hypothetical protein